MNKVSFQLVGKRFDRLVTILKFRHSKQHKWFWFCECDCGEYVLVREDLLISNVTRSCGCLNRELIKTRFITHNKSHIPEYKVWTEMKQRCLNPNHFHYEYYGGRGITVCERWKLFVNFFEDMGKRPSSKYTIERISNEKGYFLKNCVWETRLVQANNRRIYKNNTTGCNGVYWDKTYKKYKADISVNCKAIRLGRFTALPDAVAARKAAEIKYWDKIT